MMFKILATTNRKIGIAEHNNKINQLNWDYRVEIMVNNKNVKESCGIVSIITNPTAKSWLKNS